LATSSANSAAGTNRFAFSPTAGHCKFWSSNLRLTGRLAALP
jgi:hypothetical protein